MTFSPDDLLPYSNIANAKTADHAKTLLMKWTILKFEFEGADGNVRFVHPNTPSQMTSLAMKKFEPEPRHQYLMDFAEGFEGVVNDAIAESRRRNSRMDELRPVLFKLSQDEGAKAEVEHLIEDELKSTTVSEATWKGANLLSKVSKHQLASLYTMTVLTHPRHTYLQNSASTRS